MSVHKLRVTEGQCPFQKLRELQIASNSPASFVLRFAAIIVAAHGYERAHKLCSIMDDMQRMSCYTDMMLSRVLLDEHTHPRLPYAELRALAGQYITRYSHAIV